MSLLSADKGKDTVIFFQTSKERVVGPRGLGLSLWVLLVASSFWGSVALADVPEASISSHFTAKVGSFAAHDKALKSYGFQPVGSPFQPTWGLRARLYHESGLIYGGAMAYGFGLTDDDPDNPVPTTTHLVTMGGLLGYPLFGGAAVEGELGFASQAVTVGSERQGGALVYLGPYLHPRLTYTVFSRDPFLQVSLGYYLHVPLGDAHSNPLWEESFDVPVIHAGTLSVEIGFAR